MSDEFMLTPPPLKDTRFNAFRDYIETAFSWKWGMKPRWGPMEAKQLKCLLKEMPDLTEDDFKAALHNLFHSDDLPAMQRPGYWLPRIDSYLIHPHDNFGRNPSAKAKNNKRNLEDANRITDELTYEKNERNDISSVRSNGEETAEWRSYSHNLVPFNRRLQ